jgi:hypothetical protein
VLAFVDANTGRVLAVFVDEDHAQQQIAELGLQGLLVPVPESADPAHLKVHYKITLEKFDGDTDTLLETLERESEEPMFG